MFFSPATELPNMATEIFDCGAKVQKKNDITNFFRKISLINTKKSRENVAVRLFFDIGM